MSKLWPIALVARPKRGVAFGVLVFADAGLDQKHQRPLGLLNEATIWLVVHSFDQGTVSWSFLHLPSFM